MITPMQRLQFGDFEINLASRELLKRGARVPLRGRPLEVLAILVEQRGRLVTREELRHRLWPDDVFVDFDNNLNSAVARLREVLGDSVHHPQFIETLPKMGYRFIGNASSAGGLGPSQTQRRPRLLVLPFTNLTPDPDKEYFSDAMTEEIIGALAALGADRLAVIARTTAMHYKGTQMDAGTIGRELAVDYIVEGSVRLEGDGFAVNLQLIQASDQAHLWAIRYEAEAQEIFRVHREAAHAIAARIGVIPAQGDGYARIPRQPTENLVAYNVFLQGRSHMGRMDREGLLLAKQCFEEAIERDPLFARAHEALSDLYWYYGFFGFAPPKQMFAIGIFEAIRAVALDPTLGEAHALLGWYRKQVDYDWSEVSEHFQRAFEFSPQSPVVRLRFTVMILLPPGRMEEAAAEMERVMEVDPLWVLAWGWLSAMYWLGRQYDRGIEVAKLMIELSPTYYMGHYHLGVTSLDKGDIPTGVEALRKAAELSGNSPLMLGWLGLALARSGNRAEALAILDRLHQMTSHTYVPMTGFAWIHFGLGEYDETFRCLDKALDEQDPFIVPLKTYPFLDPIRSDPRYVSILRRMHLEP